MSALYVSGGQQRQRRPMLADPDVWYEYERGLLLRVEPVGGAVQVCVDYVSPPEACAPQSPQVLFKSASRQGDRLYACTQTEILIYQLPQFELSGYISLPCFNDVHHVVPTPAGTLLVANSGLDMVLELSMEGQLRRTWGVLDKDPWQRFSRSVDYRLGVSTKPHRAHPNYVFQLGEDVWATRFQQRDAICLTRPGVSIAIGGERIHDGVLSGGWLYFTSVNGQVIVVDPYRHTVEERIDLTAMHEAGTLLGWCRGILPDGPRAWIGFSHIRPTRLRENVAWVARGFRHVRTTHLGYYDLARRRCLAEIDLQSHGLDAVFGILPAREKAVGPPPPAPAPALQASGSRRSDGDESR
jgi:hypothetical protein